MNILLVMIWTLEMSRYEFLTHFYELLVPIAFLCGDCLLCNDQKLVCEVSFVILYNTVLKRITYQGCEKQDIYGLHGVRNLLP